MGKFGSFTRSNVVGRVGWRHHSRRVYDVMPLGIYLA